MGEDKSSWSVVEALAWIKWRRLEAVDQFSGKGGPARWKASSIYPGHPIRAGGRKAEDFEIHSAQPSVELTDALRRGRIIGYRVVGSDTKPFDPAFWQDGQLGPEGAFNLKSGYRWTRITFRQAEVKERWPELTQFQHHKVDLEGELRLWLEGMMSSRTKGWGDTREALRRQCKLGVGERLFNRAYLEVARKVGNGWDKSGPGKKSG